MVLIMLSGAGELNGVSISAGETWILPGATEAWNWTPTSTGADKLEWSFLLAQPPVKAIT